MRFRTLLMTAGFNRRFFMGGRIGCLFCDSSRHGRFMFAMSWFRRFFRMLRGRLRMIRCLDGAMCCGGIFRHRRLFVHNGRLGIAMAGR